MPESSCILIFDIGKTNKKVFVMDESYHVLYEKSIQLEEILDEDGFPCEDINALTEWVQTTFNDTITIFGDKIRAVNCAAYGASLVHIDAAWKPVAPLYNYLKPYPARLAEKLYSHYEGEEAFTLNTASPALGSLNAGLQLYRLKTEHPAAFEKTRFSLHLPQYISSLFNNQAFSDMTSIGCHTALWDFRIKNYHKWVTENQILPKLAPIKNGEQIIDSDFSKFSLKTGIGIHDSSAALIPYLHLIKAPFLLISTGTWSISLNPFNTLPLTKEELNQDCLCYLTTDGIPVKASRLFIGKWHDDQMVRIADYFHLDKNFFSGQTYDLEIIEHMDNMFNKADFSDEIKSEIVNPDLFFSHLKQLPSAEMAYSRLIQYIIHLQAKSSNLVLKNTVVENIYVDGGFSKNDIYMNLLKKAFPNKAVFASSISQATALGAAMTIHQHWNKTPVPESLITLKKIL